MKWSSPFRGSATGGAWSLAPTPRTREDEELLDQVASYVVRRGLGTPAVFFLESSKPMSFVGSQALVFFEPFIRVFLSTERYQRFASLMEHRSNFEYLIQRIEAAENAQSQKEREAKRAAREQKRSGTRGWRGIFGGRFRSR